MAENWKQIHAFYSTLADTDARFAPMARLAAQIHASPYAQLFPWTSMHDLCLAQAPHDWMDRGPFLRISPLFDGRIEFRYFDTHVKSRQWFRIIDEDAAFERLERFLQQLKWFAIAKAD
jgi:hypothetical protein